MDLDNIFFILFIFSIPIFFGLFYLSKKKQREAWLMFENSVANNNPIYSKKFPISFNYQINADRTLRYCQFIKTDSQFFLDLSGEIYELNQPESVFQVKEFEYAKLIIHKKGFFSEKLGLYLSDMSRDEFLEIKKWI